MDIPSGNGGETTIEREDSLPDTPYLSGQWWIELWNQNKEALSTGHAHLLRRHASACQKQSPGSLGANLGSFGSRTIRPVPWDRCGVRWSIFWGCVD